MKEGDVEDEREEEYDPRRGPPLCQACHEAQAVVLLFQVIDGEEVRAWLCRECARKDVL